MIKGRVLPVLALLLALALPGTAGGQDVVRRDGEPEVHMFQSGDPDMAAAYRAARSSVPGLVERLPKLQAAGIYASVKVPVEEDGQVEHIWLSDIRFGDGQVHGALGNTPVNLPSWSLGDPISVPLNRISDWMVVYEDRLIGGYTLFVARNRLQGEDLASFDRRVGLIFPAQPQSFD
ncbi:MAG: DUF2314 domain-containing protein [Kiloniellales bacterium]|nr:DUF2314 domain-containing protein [Kiloniellales bacterium]